MAGALTDDADAVVAKTKAPRRRGSAWRQVDVLSNVTAFY
jgi:hypothetical protein